MHHKANTLIQLLLCLLLALSTSISFAAANDSWSEVYHFQLKLAEQGNVKAQYIIGEMYEQGRGVDKDIDTAIEWFSKAEDNGHQKAANRIARIKKRIEQAEQEKARAEEDKKRREAALAKQQQAALAREEKKPFRAAPVITPSQPEEEHVSLTPEERAQKIKEAQEKAVAIAKQNALRQQQEADAELAKYRASLQAASPGKPEGTNPKYLDAFE